MKWVLLYSYYFIIIIPLLVDSREYPRETAAREVFRGDSWSVRGQ